MLRCSRITLAAVAVIVSSLSLQSEAIARRSPHFVALPFRVDVAALPAYPVEDRVKGRASARQAASRRTAGHRMASRAVRVASAIPEPRQAESGVIRSAKTGATARVYGHQPQFQALLDDLEAHGATVYYMGGYRPGTCSLRHQHSCGLAVDFCQDYRGHVSGARDCNLPRPAEFHALVVAHGLYDGSVWCDTDYGHVQARDSGGCSGTARGSWGHGRIRLASMTGEISFASEPRHHRSHHHCVRYARR